MPTIEDTEFRTIIEDARVRHAAGVALIMATDSQAMALMRLYVTVGIATASGAAAGLSTAATFVPHAVGAALAAATLAVVAGAGFCLRTMGSGEINLPGRDPDFWQWARHPGVDRTSILSAYLSALENGARINSAMNQKGAFALKRAKLCALIAPLAALMAGVVDGLIRL